MELLATKEAEVEAVRSQALQVEGVLAQQVDRRNQLRNMCGYLRKQKKAKTGEGVWQRRYFVKQGPKLLFYLSEDRQTMKGELNLRQVSGQINCCPGAFHNTQPARRSRAY